jgi:hypothetical protein
MWYDVLFAIFDLVLIKYDVLFAIFDLVLIKYDVLFAIFKDKVRYFERLTHRSHIACFSRYFR